jgi:hypothetical protein
MKYIITESQYRVLNEIGREAGHLDFEPLNSFYEYLAYNLPKKIKYKAFKEFFDKKMGTNLEIDDFYKSDVDDYFENYKTTNWNREFKTKDSRSGLAYYIANKYIGLEEEDGISYFINKKSKGTHIYYFFDPNFKIFVGRMYLVKDDDFHGKCFKVGLSTADEELIGSGYGIKMYLVVIKNMDYLISDTTLYSGSYRLWKHVLPKYVNVWGVIEKEDWLLTSRKFIEISPTKKESVRKFDYFVASIKHDDIR